MWVRVNCMKKNKLFRITSALLALMLVFTMSGVSTLIVSAAEETATVSEETTGKLSFKERFLNFFSRSSSTPTNEVTVEQHSIVEQPTVIAQPTAEPLNNVEEQEIPGFTYDDSKLNEEGGWTLTITEIPSNMCETTTNLVTESEKVRQAKVLIVKEDNIPNHAFYGDTQVNTVVFDVDGTLTLGEKCFYNTRNLTHVVFKSGITELTSGDFTTVFAGAYSGIVSDRMYFHELGESIITSDIGSKLAVGQGKTTSWGTVEIDSITYSPKTRDMDSEPTADDFTVMALIDSGHPGNYIPAVADASSLNFKRTITPRKLNSGEYTVTAEKKLYGYELSVNLTIDGADDVQISSSPETWHMSRDGEVTEEVPTIVWYDDSLLDSDGILTISEFIDFDMTDSTALIDKYPDIFSKAETVIITADSVPEYAFYNDDVLKTLKIDATGTFTFNTGSFGNTKNLSNVVFGNNVTGVSGQGSLQLFTNIGAGSNNVNELYFHNIPGSNASQVAQDLSEIAGRKVSWNDVTIDSVTHKSTGKAGVPTADDFVIMATIDSGYPGSYVPAVTGVDSLNFSRRVQSRQLTSTDYTMDVTPKDYGYELVVKLKTPGANGPINETYTYYYTISGEILDKAPTPFRVDGTYTIADGSRNYYWIVIDTWDKYEPQLVSTLNEFYITIPDGVTENSSHTIYFTDQLDKGTGTVGSTNYYASAVITKEDDLYNISLTKNDAHMVEDATAILKTLAQTSSPSVEMQVTLPLSEKVVPNGKVTTVSGTYVDKDNIPLSDLYIVLDDWNTFYTQPDEDGNYKVPIDDTSSHYIYFTNKYDPGTGSIFQGDYFLRVRVYLQLGKVYTDPGTTTSGTYSLMVDNTNTTSSGGKLKMNCKLTAYSADGSSEPYTIVKGYFTDKNGAGVQDSYIVLDDWVEYTVAKADGSYEIAVPFDKDDHYIYYTNLKTAGNAAPMRDNYYTALKVGYGTATTIYLNTYNTKSDVVHEHNKSNFNKVGDYVTSNVRLSSYEYSGVPVEPDDPDGPGEDPTTPNYEDGYITGEIINTDRSPVKNARLIITTTDGVQQGTVYRTDDNGKFEIPVKSLAQNSTGSGYSSNYRLYLMSKTWSGSGAIYNNDYIAYVGLYIYNNNSGGLYLSTSNLSRSSGITSDDITMDDSFSTSTHKVLNFVLGKNVDVGTGDDGGNPDDPGDDNVIGSDDKTYLTVTTNYVDKNGHGTGLYVVVDDWNTYAALPADNGSVTFKFNDRNSHVVYFTNSNKKKTGAVFDDDWYGRVRYDQTSLGTTVTSYRVTTDKKDNVVVENPLGDPGTNDMTDILNCRLSAYEYVPVPDGPGDEPGDEPGDGPGTGEGDIGDGTTINLSIRGKYTDTDDSAAKYYIVVDDWDTLAIKPSSATGEYILTVKDTNSHYVYFTNSTTKQSGAVTDDQWVARVHYFRIPLLGSYTATAAYNGATGTVDSLGVSNGGTSTVNISLGTGSGDDGGDGPGSGDDNPTVNGSSATIGDGEQLSYKVSGSYIKQNGSAATNYIVIDNWDVAAMKASNDGSFDVSVYNNDTHVIYFTNTATKGSGQVTDSQCIAKLTYVYDRSRSAFNIEEYKNKATITLGSSSVSAGGTSMVIVQEGTGTGGQNPDPDPGDGDNISDNIGDIGDGTLRMTITGNYMDKNGRPMDTYVVVDDWQSYAKKVDDKGTFAVRLKDMSSHTVYFTNKKMVGTGAPMPGDYYAKAFLRQTLDEDGNYFAEWNVDKLDDVDLELPKGESMENLHVTTISVRVNYYESTQETPGAGDEPEDYSGYITGELVNKSKSPIPNAKLIITDANTKQVGAIYITNSAGKFAIPVKSLNLSAGSDYRLYIMSNSWSGSGTIYADDYIAYITFQYMGATSEQGSHVININKTFHMSKEEYRNSVTIDMSNSTESHGIVNVILDGDLNVGSGGDSSVTIPSGAVLKSIEITFDGKTGKEFTPYIGRKLTKDDFMVTAVFNYTKSGENSTDVDYKQVLESKDWTCTKLNPELLVTDKLESLIFTYSYQSVKAEEVVTIQGIVQPMAIVKGSLRDANQKGMAGYAVYMNDWDVNTTTDSNGEFEFTGLIDGSYVMYITKSKKVSSSVGAIVKEPEYWFKTTIKVENGIPSWGETDNGDGVTSTSKVTNDTIAISVVYDKDDVRKVSISGTFKTSGDKGINDQYIVLDNWNNAILADSSGNYGFNNVGVGTHYLYFSNQKDKGSGNYSTTAYNYGKVKIVIGKDSIETEGSATDGADVKADSNNEENTITIDVKLSEKNEEQSTSDVVENANSEASVGSGKVEIKGTVSTSSNTPAAGFAVAIDSYDKSVNTSSSGSFAFVGVPNGTHKIVLFNVGKDGLPKDGEVATDGTGVLASFEVEVANDKIGERKIISNGVDTYGFADEEENTKLNITIKLKAGTGLTNGTVSADGSNSQAGQTVSGNSTLPQTGLDYMEDSGLLSGLAKILGEDNPIVKLLTPKDNLTSADGTTVNRIGGVERSPLQKVLAVIVIVLLLGGVGFGGYTLYKARKNRFDL